MAFPADLSNARLRIQGIDVTGRPSSGTVTIAASQRNRIGDTIIFRDSTTVTFSGGAVDVPIPVGDDTDLQSPLYLDVKVATSGGKSLQERVEVKSSDLVTVTEGGQTFQVAYLARLVSISGELPVNARGYVRSVNNVTPDVAGNVQITVSGGGGTGGAVSSVAGRTGAVVLTKGDVGLGNVDNTSDANKPISTATATALSGKAPTSHTHTSTQITDLTEAVQDIVGGLVKAGTNMTAVYDDASNTLTLNSTASGSGGTGTDAEVVRDTIAAALVAGAGIQITADDAADTITIRVSNVDASAISTGQIGLGRLGTGTASSTTYLAGDGSWKTTPVIPGNATTSTAGLLSATDKTKLDALVPASLLLWAARSPESMATGTITYNTSGAPTGHNVVWPDGATGVYAGTANATFGGSIDSYTVTHVLSGTTTTTYTQPAVTRDATSGQVTTRPAVTVA